jgi:hypothetical protein
MSDVQVKSYRAWFILNWESTLDVIGIVEVRYVIIIFLEFKLIFIYVFIYYFTINYYYI